MLLSRERRKTFQSKAKRKKIDDVLERSRKRVCRKTILPESSQRQRSWATNQTPSILFDIARKLFPSVVYIYLNWRWSRLILYTLFFLCYFSPSRMGGGTGIGVAGAVIDHPEWGGEFRLPCEFPYISPVARAGWRLHDYTSSSTT